MGISFLLQSVDHIRNIGLGIRLALPKIKVHVQARIILLKVFHGNIHNMPPHRHISLVSILQEIRRLKRFSPVFLVILRLAACRRIDLLQLAYGKRRLRRILPAKSFIKIRQVRLTLLKFSDDQSHLVAPVAQMDISQYLMSHLPCKPFDPFADDRRAQMSHMERLRHVRSAVVNNDRPGLFCRLKTHILIRTHLIQILCHIFPVKLQINEPRIHHIHFFQTPAAL